MRRLRRTRFTPHLKTLLANMREYRAISRRLQALALRSTIKAANEDACLLRPEELNEAERRLYEHGLRQIPSMLNERLGP